MLFATRRQRLENPRSEELQIVLHCGSSAPQFPPVCDFTLEVLQQNMVYEGKYEEYYLVQRLVKTALPHIPAWHRLMPFPILLVECTALGNLIESYNYN